MRIPILIFSAAIAAAAFQNCSEGFRGTHLNSLESQASQASQNIEPMDSYLKVDAAVCAKSEAEVVAEIIRQLQGAIDFLTANGAAANIANRTAITTLKKYIDQVNSDPAFQHLTVTRACSQFGSGQQAPMPVPVPTPGQSVGPIPSNVLEDFDQLMAFYALEFSINDLQSISSVSFIDRIKIGGSNFFHVVFFANKMPYYFSRAHYFYDSMGIRLLKLEPPQGGGFAHYIAQTPFDKFKYSTCDQAGFPTSKVSPALPADCAITTARTEETLRVVHNKNYQIPTVCKGHDFELRVGQSTMAYSVGVADTCPAPVTITCESFDLGTGLRFTPYLSSGYFSKCEKPFAGYDGSGI